jgi:predicted DCC family thiol-disulfide oxidoreductase YuxK
MARATVIYDADCGFCKFSLALLLSWDRQSTGREGALRPLPLGTAEAVRLLADLTLEQREGSWHLVDESGRRNSAGAALAPALALLPGGRGPAALVARMPHVTERAYRWVVDHRSLLGRFIPTPARRWAGRVIAAHGGPGA